MNNQKQIEKINYRDKEEPNVLLFVDKKIKKPVCFQYSVLRRHVKFENCIFEDDVVWGDESCSETCSQANQDIFFINCIFKKKVLMDGIDCRGGIYFKKCKFEYQSGNSIDYALSLCGANIRIAVEFSNCNFKGGINMNGCTIEKMGCLFDNVKVINEKCHINLIAANFAKELLLKECDIYCEAFCGNCINAGHILIGATDEQWRVHCENKENKEIMSDSIQNTIPNINITNCTIEDELVYIETDTTQRYWGVFLEEELLIVTKANIFIVNTLFDMSYTKTEDKFSISNCIIKSGRLDISNSKSRDFEICNSNIENMFFDCRHIYSDWIINIQCNKIKTATITFNGLICKGGLFLQKTHYNHFEQSSQEEVNGIDLSFASLGVNLQIEYLTINTKAEMQREFNLKLDSSKIGQNIILNHIKTIDNRVILCCMDHLIATEWQYYNELENICFSLNQINIASFHFYANETSTEEPFQGLNRILKNIQIESKDYFLKLSENILRISGKENDSEILMKNRINKQLKSKYNIFTYYLVKRMYYLVGYGLSNKRLIHHAFMAMITMCCINIFYASGCIFENISCI